MEPAWRPQGRGRGRKSEAPAERVREKPGSGAGRGGSGTGRGGSGTGRGGNAKTMLLLFWRTGASGPAKFEEIRKSNQAAAQRLMERHTNCSSSSEEEDDDDDDKEHKDARVLQSTFITYASHTGGDITDLQRTGQYVSELFQSGALTCLICIALVKRTQPVWSCSGCFSLFHLPCIQKWARDSVFLLCSATDEDFGRKQHPWPW
uniref:Uncharacterized protein n=1 Tax=Hippocampus comes TaxID=109280 RepID=A0A3Q2YKF6_HIPCM